jgi:flagellar biosynthesis component FlhA
MHIPLSDIKLIMNDTKQGYLKTLLETRASGIQSQIEELKYSKYLIESVLKSYGQNDLSKQSLKGFLQEQIFLKRKDERWLKMIDHESKIILEIGEGLIPIAISENSESLVTGIKKLREELRRIHHYDLDLINLKDNTKDLKAYEYQILVNDEIRLKKTLDVTDKNKQMDAILTNLKAIIL